MQTEMNPEPKLELKLTIERGGDGAYHISAGLGRSTISTSGQSVPSTFDWLWQAIERRISDLGWEALCRNPN